MRGGGPMRGKDVRDIVEYVFAAAGIPKAAYGFTRSHLEVLTVAGKIEVETRPGLSYWEAKRFEARVQTIADEIMRARAQRQQTDIEELIR